MISTQYTKPIIDLKFKSDKKKTIDYIGDVSRVVNKKDNYALSGLLMLALSKRIAYI